MTVAELIAELQKRDPCSVVETWDAYNDVSTDSVYVSDMTGGRTMISDTDFGHKIDNLNAQADVDISDGGWEVGI